MYRSSTQSCPTKAYVPQSETLNSLSAYHCGQGGGATCFISFPEYSGPAYAAEARAAIAQKATVSFFITWLSVTSSGEVVNRKCKNILLILLRREIYLNFP